MKKIITNTILKKFIWTTLLIMIVFQVCFPCLVLADDLTINEFCYDANVTATYGEWLNFIENDLDVPEEDIPAFERELLVQAVWSMEVDLGINALEHPGEFTEKELEQILLLEKDNIIFEVTIYDPEAYGIFVSGNSIYRQ